MDAPTVVAYDKPVPRYTSYPTAAQFDQKVGPAEQEMWLKGLKGAFAALYLHVPFCRQLCWYCACNTVAMRREETLDTYAQALIRELELVSQTAPDLGVGSVQWGGGTPSQLGASRLMSVGRRLAALFDRRSGAEMSMEVDPRFCDAEFVDAAAMLGVNRASLGVQDFDDSVQRAINRLQSFEVTAAALERLRGAGIRRCNIDLVYGLPQQTLETLSRTLDQALALHPDRFAIFAYAHVPWMKARQRLIDTETLPDATVRAAMAGLVSDRLVEAGYVKIGLDHYARPDDPLALAAASGRLRRNFQGYVADQSPWVVGIGASAISCLPQGYSQNAAQAAAYIGAVEQGGFATVRGVALEAGDRLRGEIIGRLMCGYAVDLARICRRHGIALATFLESISALPSLVSDGLVSMDGARLDVTDRGRPLVRSVCAAFDRYHTGAEGRHARGI
jgi:oxygen-independent coproporphyrinogen-3 oxidase